MREATSILPYCIYLKVGGEEENLPPHHHQQMNPLTRERKKRYQQLLVAVVTQYVMLLLPGFPHKHQMQQPWYWKERQTHSRSHFNSLCSFHKTTQLAILKVCYFTKQARINKARTKELHNGLGRRRKEKGTGRGISFILGMEGFFPISWSPSKVHCPWRNVEHGRIKLLASKWRAFRIPALLEHLVDFHLMTLWLAL